MLAEDGITIPSYTAGTEDTGASLCPQHIEKWAMAAQNRFMDTMNAPAEPIAIHVESIPVVLRTASAPACGKLGLEQPGIVARHTEPATQDSVDLPPMPTQENTLEVPQLPPRYQVATASAELDAAPPAFSWTFNRAEQMGASAVSRIAFAIGRRLSQLGAQAG
jgi:hypothetical protein